MKSKLLAFGLFSLIALGAMAENIPDLLVVWAKDGSKPSFALSENPSISFTASDLVVKTKDVEVNYALANLLRLTYEKNDITGVTDIATGKPLLRLQRNAIYFPLLPAQSQVDVYRTNGTKVMSKRIEKEGAYTFSIEELAAGTYLVRVEGDTYKIVKR